MLNIRKYDSAGLTTPAEAPPAMPTGAWQAATSSPSANSPSIIGPDLTIIGNLLSRGDVQIDGEIQGDIHANSIMVGEAAKVTGAIVADEVVVHGTATGSIRGKHVMLRSSSHVEGDVFHQKLSIEQGAFFEGKSRRSEDPTGGIARSEVPDLRSRPIS
jgi:cytoskeletal protein CcmA (bactofilin family)